LKEQFDSAMGYTTAF